MSHAVVRWAAGLKILLLLLRAPHTSCFLKKNNYMMQDVIINYAPCLTSLDDSWADLRNIQRCMPTYNCVHSTYFLLCCSEETLVSQWNKLNNNLGYYTLNQQWRAIVSLKNRSGRSGEVANFTLLEGTWEKGWTKGNKMEMNRNIKKAMKTINQHQSTILICGGCWAMILNYN